MNETTTQTPVNQNDDPMRGTGRTTSGMLRAIAQALDAPERWVPFMDHSGKTDPTMFKNLFLRMSIDLGLVIAVRENKSGNGVEIHSALRELRARQLPDMIVPDDEDDWESQLLGKRDDETTRDYCQRMADLARASGNEDGAMEIEANIARFDANEAAGVTIQDVSSGTLSES